MLFAAFENYVRGTLEPEMHAVDPATGFDFQELSAIPALNIDPGDEVVTFAKRLAGRNDHGKVAFGTEAGLFQTRVGIPTVIRSEEHTSELQSLMRTQYAVFCLKKKKHKKNIR